MQRILEAGDYSEDVGMVGDYLLIRMERNRVAVVAQYLLLDDLWYVLLAFRALLIARHTYSTISTCTNNHYH